jgi:hypothetical protein
MEKSLIKSRIALDKAIKTNDDQLIWYYNIAANFDGIAEVDSFRFCYKKGLLYADKTNMNSKLAL